MKLKTYLAVGELVQAAAHIHGVTGPVMFTASETDWCNNCGDCDQCRDDDWVGRNGLVSMWENGITPGSVTDINSRPIEEEFFYAQSFC